MVGILHTVTNSMYAYIGSAEFILTVARAMMVDFVWHQSDVSVFRNPKSE